MTSPDDHIEHYHHLLLRLGETIGLESLSADADHRCRLVFDDVLEVTMDAVPSDGIVWIHGSAGPAPMRNATEIYRRLLNAACFGQGTQGAGIALDEIGNTVMLQRDVFLGGLSYDRFESILTDFVNALETWRGRLIGGGIALSESAPAIQESAVQAVRA